MIADKYKVSKLRRKIETILLRAGVDKNNDAENVAEELMSIIDEIIEIDRDITINSIKHYIERRYDLIDFHSVNGDAWLKKELLIEYLEKCLVNKSSQFHSDYVWERLDRLLKKLETIIAISGKKK